MGARTASTTRANTSTSTLRAPARSSARAQASDGGAGGQHVVDQDEPAPGDLGLAVGRHPERALHIVRRARPATARPAARVALTRLSAVVGDRHAGFAATIACASSADWLKRRAHSRRQCSGTGTSASASASSSRPARAIQRPIIGREVEPVAIFQGMHQRARDVVVAHRGAGPVIGRRIGDRLHRQHAGAGIVGERNAEPLAIGRRDQRQLRPAGGAQPAVADRLAAGRAERRQRHVAAPARKPPEMELPYGLTAPAFTVFADVCCTGGEATAVMRTPQRPPRLVNVAGGRACERREWPARRG